jgi:predicted lipoprotein with Yx(FWY)xxD motif
VRKALMALAAMAAVACGGSTASTSATPSSISSPSAAAVTGPATIAVATNDKLGKILVDGSGKTLYLFAKDTGSTSTCYGGCATYWPPVLTDGAPRAGAGVNASLLGTTKRTDGTTEVTYGGHPLYYVVTDHNPGDATGQAVTNFGAAWYVVGPDGNKIQS